MPVLIKVHESQSYFHTKYIGKLTDDEVMKAVRAFYEGPEWRPGLNEIADFTQADVTLTTSDGLMKMAGFVSSHLRKHGAENYKLAIITQKQLVYGLTRIYAAWMRNSPLEIAVFNDIVDARKWLGLTQDE